MGVQHELTNRLAAPQAGDPDASGQGAPGQEAATSEAPGQSDFDRLFLLVYDELRAMAHRQLRHERQGHTLSTTALVHEAYLKLADHTRLQWRDRNHFLAIAARAMRHILVDYARERGAAKRAGSHAQVSLDEALLGDDATSDALAAAAACADDLLTLDAALTRFAALDPRASQVIECRFFGGMSEAEIADALGLTKRTVRRDWAKARAWLARSLQK